MTRPSDVLYRFGGFEFDPCSATLKKAGNETLLRKKSFLVLLLLIEERGRIVTKERLMEEVWADSFVTDDALVQSVVELRKLLGDPPSDATFIQTVRGVGYRFVAPVEIIGSPLSPVFRREEVTEFEMTLEEEVEADTPAGWMHHFNGLRPEVLLGIAAILLAGFLLTLSWNGTSASDLIGVSGNGTSNVEAFELYRAGLAKAERHEYAEGIDLLKQAVALDPNFALAYGRIGYVYASVWNLAEEARPYLDKALELSDRLSEKEQLYVLTWSRLADRDYAGAEEVLQRLVSRYPLEVEAMLSLGTLLEGENRLEEAARILERGLRIDAGHKYICNRLGGIYSLMGRHEAAISAIKRYVFLASDEANAYDSLGLVYNWAGRYEEAIAAYQEALRLDPGFHLALSHLGDTYFQTGRYRAALRQFDRYIESAPGAREKGEGYGKRFWVYWSLNRPEPAREALDRIEETGVSTHGQRLLIAIRSGDARLIGQALEKTRQYVTPYTARGRRGTPRFQYHREAMAFQTLGKWKQAEELFRQALKEVPPTFSTDAFEDMLGRAYLKARLWDEAIAEFERVLALNPRYPLAHFHLAKAWLGQGDRRTAGSLLQKFLEVWKDADADIPQVVEAHRLLGELHPVSARLTVP